jgi:dTDP-4-dehydrorhamnose reductase
LKPVILVTGAKGQLGNELQVLSKQYSQYDFLFTDVDELSIGDEVAVNNFFDQYKPNYCINCAAYTAVDKAESDSTTAHLVNVTGPSVLATACNKHNAKFIHISTDYVFDGESEVPYVETDATKPSSVYGITKLEGEQNSIANNPNTIIIRTAWVYSFFGNNFVKTMMRLMNERPTINVVNDQIGAPTYAADLAGVIMQIIETNKWQAGIYHYSNKGKISWYDFAIAIKNNIAPSCEVNPISTAQYPTLAKRPSFSLLNTQKIQTVYNIHIPDWKDSLHACMKLLTSK